MLIYFPSGASSETEKLQASSSVAAAVGGPPASDSPLVGEF